MTQTQAALHEVEGVAIIGMSARFPGANSVAEFWRNVRDGVESIAHFSDDELLKWGTSSAELHAPTLVRTGRVLDRVEYFDADFFDIPASQAAIMDPQHRFFLECAWEALEDGGYDPATYPGWISVFGGAGIGNYLIERLLPLRSQLETSGGPQALQVVLVNKNDYLTTRVSYKLNLKGASFNVQTACSTALVASHLACQSLLSYQCDMALAGAVSIGRQRSGYHTQSGFLSPDGRVRPFDAEAQGTVFGQGIGIVLLKRLSEALEDGDHIYAVIRGSAINNDGSSKVGFTAPSVDGQVGVLSVAYAAAGIDPESISYIEAHGTGTALGDPIEAEALMQVFRAKTDRKQFCPIGSVKGNIGHTDTSAGAAGLIKAALALEHRLIPPSLNYKTPNPKIDFSNSPFYVNTELSEWKNDGQPRRAGVSAFGMGGTNAHLILEEAPALEPSSASRPHQLLCWSARVDASLEGMTDRLAEYLHANLDVKLPDVAYTLHAGRHAFDRRRMLVCDSAADAVSVLQARDPRRMLTGSPTKQERGVVFMFSGQGAQHVNMGRELYQREALFREHVDRCAELLRPHLDLDLRQVLYPAEADIEKATEQINQTWLTQPALFTIEYALAQLWMAWGLNPQALIGHSIGEYVAACLADVFDLESALALVAARGRLMQSMPRGSMLSVTLSEKDVQSFLDGALVVAAVNEPSGCVVAGPTEAVAAMEQMLNQKGIGYRRLHTSHAFHSTMMEPILGPFREYVSRVPLRAPQIPYLSNLTGDWITADQATDPAYWAQHVRRAVRFSEGVSLLARSPDQVLLEVGPGDALRTLAQRHPGRSAEQIVLASMRRPRDTYDDQVVLLQTLGQLWLNGVTVDWKAFYAGERRLRLPLPTYSFDRRRHWVDAPEDEEEPARAASLFKNANIAKWFYIPSWKRTLPPVLEPQAASSRWLVLGGGDNLSLKLAEQLEARGHSVVRAEAGEQFRPGDSVFSLRPSEREDYEALFNLLAERGQSPTHIAHLWNVASLDETDPDFIDQTLARSFYSLLSLAQAIGKSALGSLQLAVFSSGVQQVSGDESLQPEKAALLGPCKVIPQELREVVCRSIDIVRPEAGSIREAQLVEQLVAELETPSEDVFIAYRDDNRWVRTYELAPMPDITDQLDGRLRERGVYLITGGLGGIGLTLAQYLARAMQARLILTSRSPFPRRESWEHYLATHNPRDRTVQSIRAVQELEALGAEVWVAQADVADAAQMAEVVRAGCGRFGAIHGVIHSAGLPGGGIMQLKAPEAAAKVLAPKIHGTRAIEAALRDLPLDFFALCSSISALTGGIGQVDYCAANSFMDAYAQAMNRRKGATIVSINWDAWGEVGMAVNTAPTYTAARPAAAIAKTEVNHPMLRTVYAETDERAIFEMQMDPAKHWVLSEHVLLGIPTVPGTTYLELVRAAYANRTHSAQFEIREALFLEPLRVAEGDRKALQLILEGRAGSFDFRVISWHGAAANGETLWQTHVIGQIAPLIDAASQVYDLGAIRERCNELDVTASAEEVRQKGLADDYLRFGPRWYDTHRYVRAGQDEALIELELAAAFKDDLESFLLHPALMDVAVSFSSGRVGQGRYLPFSYKQMRCYDRLPGKLYAYTRLKPGTVAGAETIAFRIALLDEQGRTIVDIHEFTMKRVGEAAATRLRGSEEENQPSPTETAANSRRGRALSQAILPEEGVEAFRRILARSRQPQIVVCTKHLPAVLQRAREATPEGYADGAAKPQVPVSKHVRPDLQTSYVAPRSEVETKLADIWQDMLGVDKVGINDNFFELGGDSIMGMQIVAKIRAVGFEVSAEQIFQNQTIAQLANILQPGGAGGEIRLPLTARQQSLLARAGGAPYLLVIAPNRRLDLGQFEQALQSVAAQHDALRLQFHPTDDGWFQSIADHPQSIRVSTVELGSVPPEERDDALRAEVARLEHSFDANDPAFLRAVYVRMDSEGADRALVAVSPFSIDEASLPIFLQDLDRAYRQESPLPATASFAEWATHAATYARSDELQAEREYWQSLAAQAFEPLPFAGEGSGLRQIVSARLSAEDTETLLGLPESYRMEPEEVILTALAQVVGAWSDQNRLLIGASDDGRQGTIDALDVTRTIGCLRVDYPLGLELPTPENTDALLRSVKEQVRRVPGRGRGYGYLCAADESLALSPALAFTYCPPLDNELLSVTQLNAPGDDAPLQLNASVRAGQLDLSWQYDTAAIERATITRLGDELVETLRRLIQHCRESGGAAMTPSDFPEAELDQAALESLLARLK